MPRGAPILRLFAVFSGPAEYRETPHDLLARCGLRCHAGVFHLWALGICAVISGDFFGWNFGLLAGGFGGKLTVSWQSRLIGIMRRIS
ncbi:MAG: hypothetical protein JO097_20740 [Acidobacteriaceae bacterium]|nr:hypothetical protein [Acidobacteriaceae bacterium]MBV9764270.1 hypothetical protein [Acidobacteriaceae bacterium]